MLRLLCLFTLFAPSSHTQAGMKMGVPGDTDGNGEMVRPMNNDIANCESACDANAECTAVIPYGGNCYLRKPTDFTTLPFRGDTDVYRKRSDAECAVVNICVDCSCHTCDNGGTCWAFAGGVGCHCSDDFIGARCEEAYIPWRDALKEVRCWTEQGARLCHWFRL